MQIKYANQGNADEEGIGGGKGSQRGDRGRKRLTTRGSEEEKANNEGIGGGEGQQ
jgi:hypothetical protein